MKNSNCRAGRGENSKAEVGTYFGSYNNNDIRNNNRVKQPVGMISLMALAIGAALSLSANAQVDGSKYGRNIDNRLLNNQVFRTQAPKVEQISGLQALQEKMPNVTARYNAYGVTSMITNPEGFVATNTGQQGLSTADIAIGFIQNNVGVLGLSTSDIETMVLKDVVPSVSGVTHYYYEQNYRGIPVYNTRLQVHVTSTGDISLLSNSFVSDLDSAVTSMTPMISAADAIIAAARTLNVAIDAVPELQNQMSDTQTTHVFRHEQLSPENILAKLIFIQTGPGEVSLAWNFQFQMDHSWPDVTVNASTGELITSFDMMSDGTFHVYGEPIESPNHTDPLPPADGRIFVVDPEDSLASPEGWFTPGSTLMDGNNVHACADRDGNNSCDSPQPSCSGLVCDFPIDLTSDPSAYQAAAIANLFYWNNVIHDVQYQYGFDEVGGNFQEDNFGRGGSGSDSVNADAQDNALGGSRCNANFATQPDGSNPRMQMYLCNEASPLIDGDLDNGVIVHEYGHGISIRQVGGPSTASCLNNSQQGGEGWSDWLALAYTAEAGDQGTDARGVGSYLFDLPTDGSIRPQQYSTNPAVNSYTYASLNGLSIPHGVGSVWAQALWEVYWVLVDAHGFEDNLLEFDIDDPNEAGNKRAMFYVNEGLKNTACSPTHVDARDGVIAAVNSSFGGEDLCRVWGAFADYGLGVDAVSGGSNSTNPSNGFSLPAACVEPPDTTCPDGSEALYVAEFELGNESWTDAGSSCSTGNFVQGTPNFQEDGGIVTQVAGAASGSGALFTALNTAIGTDDVDGGTCTSESPSIDLSGEAAVEVMLSYFHGQRDPGDDAEDGFSIELLDNNSVIESLVSVGDVSANAEWSEVSTVINSPGELQFRISATDGASTGDIVEAGIDRVMICSAGPVGPIPSPTPTPVVTPSPGCTIEESFESGSDGGWTNSTASTCSTGSFIAATPTEQSNGGVVTQVGGAFSGSGALFTATNSSAGVNDVDGGNCIVESPTYVVGESSELSLAYFHGQRDAADDQAGDFFSIEYSTDGGSSFTVLTSVGDETSNAQWQTVSTAIPSGSNVVIRSQCSDGADQGDLVECGLDQVTICPLQ